MILRFRQFYGPLLSLLASATLLGLPLVLPLPTALEVWLVACLASCLLLLGLSLSRHEWGLSPGFCRAFLSLLGFKALFALVLVVSVLLGRAPTEVTRLGELLLRDSPKLAFLLVLAFWVVSARATVCCSRVCQVCARYTLDVAPARFMMVDSDLFSGLIESEEASRTRAQIANRLERMNFQSQSADGLRIVGTLIWSVMGLGLLLGVGLLLYLAAGWELWHRGLASFVGAGALLVGQLSLLATALGLVVVRGLDRRDREDFGDGLPCRKEVTLLMAGAGFELVALAGLGLPPGTSLGLQAFFKTNARVSREWEAERSCGSERVRRIEFATATRSAPVTVELGKGLLELIEYSGQDSLSTRIGEARKELAAELGFLPPAISLRGMPELAPFAYRIWLEDQIVAHSRVKPGRQLALASEGECGNLPGSLVADPDWGLVGRWIRPDQEGTAGELGCPVLDINSVIATHTNQVMRREAHQLLSDGQVESLLERYGLERPELRENRSWIKAVLEDLLEGGATLKQSDRIFSVILDQAYEGWTVSEMADLIRSHLGAEICAELVNSRGRLYVLKFDPGVEEDLAGDTFPLGWTERFRAATELSVDTLWEEGVRPVIVTSQRRLVLTLLADLHPELRVLSPSDIPSSVDLVPLGSVTLVS